MKYLLFFLIWLMPCYSFTEDLFIFAGSAIKLPLDEVISEYYKEKGVSVYVSYGGSGFVLSQMELSRRGDIYFPASPDFMEKAKKKGLVVPETEKRIAYLIPVIGVKKGNPLKINSLKDLTRDGIKVGIANPESVCVGLYALEIFEYNRLINEIKDNIVVEVESCEKTASILAMGAVDAVIGWDVFGKWHPERIEIVPLKPEEIPRIAYIPVAVSVFTKNKLQAEKFIEFLHSARSIQIFNKYGYITDETDAKRQAPFSKIGGEYIPDKYHILK